MPRKLRVESSDHIYHVINRGNYRSFIFEDEGAKRGFERTLAEACLRNSWQLHAYCILSNHFHLCLSTPKGNLSEGMRWLQATFATRFNRLRKESGHLFQGRFKSLLVEPGAGLSRLVDYIHLNPLRAGLEKADTLGSYQWSSLHHFSKRSSRPNFLDCSWLSNLDGVSDTTGGWMRYKNLLRMQVADEPEAIANLEKEMNRGWCIGSEDFKRANSAGFLKKDGVARLGHEELKEFNQLQWESYVLAALKAVRKTQADVTAGKYSEAWKLAIASKMKRETSVTNQWLSDRLNMGVANGVSSNCGIYRQLHEQDCQHAQQLVKLKIGH
jgi:REP element-mobilizing transposase RayT